MSHSNVSSISDTVHKTQVWLKGLREIDEFSDEPQACSALRAVPTVLRNRLPAGKAWGQVSTSYRAVSRAGVGPGGGSVLLSAK